MIDTVSITIFD